MFIPDIEIQFSSNTCMNRLHYTVKVFYL